MENWCYEKEALEVFARHYETEEPLSDTLIEQLVKSKNCVTGTMIQRQCYLSFLSLIYFGKDPADQDTTQTMQDLYAKICPNYKNSKESHWQLSFGHLTSYGPKYYSYLWSKVFALDLFDKVKEKGLLDPKIGHLYRKKILEPGGAIDPNKLLEDFLGRAPNSDAFFRDLGL